ncbi:MAG: hypothetical protein JSR93_02555 [Verrucomicrobia bacterium]|nr:hypothetical protein [Verrucomicrobiota bacterium]
MAHSISQDTPSAALPQCAINCLNALGAAGSVAGSVAGSAGITALTSAVFSITNPITGAVFGATYTVTSLVTNGICNYTGCSANNGLLKAAQCGLSIILSTAAAWALCNAIGMPITFAAAAVLTAVSAAVVIGVSLAVGTVIGCGVLACLAAEQLILNKLSND